MVLESDFAVDKDKQSCLALLADGSLVILGSFGFPLGFRGIKTCPFTSSTCLGRTRTSHFKDHYGLSHPFTGFPCFFSQNPISLSHLSLIFFAVIKCQRLVGGVDNFLLRFLGSGDNPALRLVGLIRLVRLIRLLHLVKDLARMVKGFVGTLGAAFLRMSSCHANIYIYIYIGNIYSNGRVWGRVVYVRWTEMGLRWFSGDRGISSNSRKMQHIILIDTF